MRVSRVGMSERGIPSGNDGDNVKALVRQLDWMRVREATWQNRWMAAVVVVAAAGLRYFST